MGITVFTTIGNEINEVVNTVLLDAQNGYIKELITVAEVGLILYFFVFGYSVLAGKRQLPFNDLVWECARFVIVLAFMQGSHGLLGLLTEAVDQLKGFFSGGENTYSLLDNKLDAFVDISIDLWKSAKGISGTFLAFINIISLLPLLTGFAFCGSLIIYSEIILKILMVTAPILFLFNVGLFAEYIFTMVEAI